MKLQLLCLAFIFIAEICNAQVNWILEPTQDSKHFVTPGIDGFDFIIVKYDDRTSKAVNSSGKTLIERDRLIWPPFDSRDKLIAVRRENENFKFYNQDFECVTEGYDEALTQRGYNTLSTVKNGLLGLIDIEGNVLIENKYKLLKRISIGKFKAITADGEDIVIAIDDKPDLKNFPKCEIEGNTFYRTLDGNSSGLVITDINGDTLLHHSKYTTYYTSKCPAVLLDSFIMVKSLTNKRHGLINLQGKLVVDANYTSMDQVDALPHFMNVRTDNKKLSVLDLRFKTISSYGYDEAYVRKSNIRVKKGEFSAILDLDGNVVVPPIYNAIIEKDSSYAFIRNDTIFVYSTKKNAFAQDTFNSIIRGAPETYMLGNGNKYCLYDGTNLEFITDTVYTKIKQVRNYFECTYNTYDTTYYDPPKQLKNYKGEVTRTYSSTSRKVYHYEFRNLKGELMYGPIQRSLTFLNDTFSMHYIPKTDSIAFVNTKTFQSQIFHGSKINNAKGGKEYDIKGIVKVDSNFYILNHFLDPSIDAVPYEYLQYDDKTGVYIYKEGEKYGLLNKDNMLTEPEFDKLEKRGEYSRYQYIAEVNGFYGLLEVENDAGW